MNKRFPIRPTGEIFPRKIVFACVAAALLPYWDSLLHLLGEALHLGIEVLELSFEHSVEAVFGLSPRDAQVVTAWTGLGLAVYLLRRGYLAARRRWGAFRRQAVSHWAGHRLQWVLALAAVVVFVVF
jgi:hypothetical protein